MSNGLVLVTVLVAVASTEATSVSKKKKFDIEAVIGGFILGVFLYALGMVNAKITTYLCILIIVTSLALNGKPMFNALTGKE